MSFTDPQGRPLREIGEPRRADSEPSSGVSEIELGEAQTRSSSTDREVGNPPRLPRPARRRRRWLLPLLFVATCASTFLVGCTNWYPLELWTLMTGDAMPLRRGVIAHWQDGLIYMTCLIGILLTHEMGHYLATRIYRIPATPPIFIPFPIHPFGTLGAVIGMKGMQADRRQMFDIGIAGPLAGLVVALPVMWIGIQQLQLDETGMGAFRLDLPLAVKWTMAAVPPAGYTPQAEVWQSQLNPYFMAGWVGFLVTGLNMMPVSQLDGGHVMYTLFGRWSHWVARLLMFSLVTLIVIDLIARWRMGYFVLQVGNRWWLMAVLVLVIGTDHPPTRDDSVPLGWPRTILGCLSLLIPILCFAPRLLYLTP